MSPVKYDSEYKFSGSLAKSSKENKFQLSYFFISILLQTSLTLQVYYDTV
jgi:hypothetical protein